MTVKAPLLPHLFSAELATLLVDVPSDSIISRTIYRDQQVKAVLFGFAPGQSLSQHTASTPAIIHILSGEGEIGLGDELQPARAGTWVHMPANLQHSVFAKTAVTMLLILLQGNSAEGDA